MNVYIIVEGKCTETIVIPQWLKVLAPKTLRINNPWDVNENNYYLFDAGGIPQIYKHIINAVRDVSAINQSGERHYDYIMVLMDVEEETRDIIEQRIQEELIAAQVDLVNAELVLFEQEVCIESWFLGNRTIYKDNPQDEILRSYTSYYNVKTDNPELMGNINIDKFATRAQFHNSYLSHIFNERHIKYKKNSPDAVCEPTYLEKLIDRYNKTGHIKTFGAWYEFIINHFV